ncbi:hypothetical protein ACHWQZ_G019147 [Mnemiopsis leidyi]
MGEVIRRSDSKGDISSLLNDIKDIVNNNRGTLDALKAIKQRNDEISKTKKRVDIPSVVAGHKKSEIDIPHKRAKGGERESEINKRNKKFDPAEDPEPETVPPEDYIPTISVGTVGPVESAPPPGHSASTSPTDRSPPQRLPRRDKSEERRRDRRDKSIERKKRMDAIRQKTYDRKKDPVKPNTTPTPRRGRNPERRREPEKKKEEEKPEPPSRRRGPGQNGERRRRSPRSSPGRYDLTDGVPLTVEVGNGPTEHASAPPTTHNRGSPTREQPPEPPTRLYSRGRTPSGHSDNGGHGHVFRIRKHSEGSVEIFPEFIEEHKITSEYRNPSLSGSNENIDARPGVSPGRSLPRNATSQWYSKADLSTTTCYSRENSMKRRIILERCPHCQDGVFSDSPPEIEIRICKRSAKCGKFRSEDNIHIIPQESLNLETQPSPPVRGSSLTRTQKPATNYDKPMSPTWRPMSPSEQEMERLSARLAALKKEVNNVIRDCENDAPINISIRDLEDRPKSPYYPDKTPYYRARYHSAPISPTGQNDKTTSTTELPQVYHPAREEKRLPTNQNTRLAQTIPEVLHLSTQSLEIPEDDGVPITDLLELEVQSLTEDQAPELQSHFMPVQNQAPGRYDQEYDVECDLGESTNHVNLDINNRPKREEQLLTPPPLPDRDGGTQPDITLRGDNLYDPYHIGTTFVVLSRQNHGRFKFSNPLDPNSSAPGSPKPSTPGSSPMRGRSPQRAPNSSTSGSSPRVPARNKPAEIPVISPVVAAPVSATPPTSATSTRRPLYQPKSLNGSLMSLSASRPDVGLDTTPSKLIEPSRPTVTSAPISKNGGPPPLPMRNPGKAMTPEQRRGFQRPVKEPVFRELAVDAPDRPLLPERKNSLLDQQKNSASREFHLQTMMEVERPAKLDTWSGAMPPATSRGHVIMRPFSPHSESTLRRTMPHVKLLGDEWKELAQRLGYENSQIASFSRDFPDPGQALLDHWSKLPESKLDDLLKQLKSMDLWKTADTLDKTFDNTNV